MELVLALALLAPRQDSLESLIDRLGHEDLSVREQAMARLLKRPLSDLPSLEAAYKSESDPERRARLSRVLPQIRKHRHADLLAKLKSSGDTKEAAAGKALAALDARGVVGALSGWTAPPPNAIIAALLDMCREDQSVFKVILRDHSYNIPPEHASRAIHCLSVSDPELCAEAIKYLSRVRPKNDVADWEAISIRVIRLSRGKSPVRKQALRALPVLSDARAIPALLESLDDADAEVNLAGVRALRTIVRARPELAEHARAAGRFIGAESADLRRAAFETLATRPLPEDVERVRGALASETPEVCWGALELAVSLREPSLVREIARRISEKDGAKAVEALFQTSVQTAAKYLPRSFQKHAPITVARIEHVATYGTREEIAALAEGVSRTLAGDNKDVWPAALEAAEFLGTGFSGEVLVGLLAHSRFSVRVKAFEILGTPHVEMIRAGLRDPEQWVRREAILAASRLKAAECAPDIAALLEADKDVRREALEALAVLGDRSVLPQVRPWLNKRRVESEALEALAVLGTREDVPLLLEFARSITSRDRDWVKGLALEAVVKIQGPDAKETLRPLIRDRRLRAKVLTQLAALKAPEVASEVARYLDDSDDETVRAAAEIVGSARYVPAIPDLVGLLRDGAIAQIAARALGQMPSASIVPHMRGLLERGSAVDRRRAAEVLNALDADFLAADLAKLLSDPSAGVRRQGVEATRRLAARGHLDAIAAASRDKPASLAEAAIVTLVELDWEGQREGLLKRLKTPEEPYRVAIARRFAAKHDSAVLTPLLEMTSDAEVGFEALCLLNAFREPEAYARLLSRTVDSIGNSSFDTCPERRRKLAESFAIQLKVGWKLPAAPRASFETDFGFDTSFRWSIGGGGSAWSRGGSFTFFEAARAKLGAGVIAIVEKDHVRLVSKYEALRFWRQWGRTR